MQEDLENGKWIPYFLKVIAPAIAAAAINISVMVKSKKATFVGGIVSAIIALSTAYILGDYVLKHYYNDTAIIIGGVVIISEKVMMFILTRFNWNAFLKKIMDMLFRIYGK